MSLLDRDHLEHNILDDLDDARARITELEKDTPYVPGDTTIAVSTFNVSSPPTDAQLDSAFGTPATVGAGFIGFVDDNGAGTTVWLVVSTGASWWYEQLTKAV